MNLRQAHRLFWICALSMGAMAAIIYLSDPADPVGPDGGPGRPLQASELPPRFAGTGAARPVSMAAFGASGPTVVQETDREGNLRREYSYQAIDPLEDGVFDLEQPQARIYLAPWRVVHLQADRGRFLAPDNHPRSGRFQDNLVVTVFEAPPGKVVDASPSSPDRSIRILLDEASFDTLLGEIESDGPLEILTPKTQQVRFRGRGLKLRYNEVANRVEYLQIAEGHALRYRLDPADKKGSVLDRVARRPDKKPGAGESAERVQFYRVTFEQAVKVVSEGRTIRADRLEAWFRMDRSAPPQSPAATVGRGGPTGLPRALVHAALAGIGRGMVGLVGAVEQDAAPLLRAGRTPGDPEPKPRAEPKAAVEEMVLTWSGAMVMVPAKQLPAAMNGDQDLFLRFDGEPVRVEDPDQRQLTCRRLEYLDSAKLLTATGSEAFPMRLQAPDLGTVAAPVLKLWTEKHQAQLLGPGRLRAAEAPETAAATGKAGEAKPKPTGLPPGFAIAWSKQAELHFTAPDEKKGGGQIKSASFRGDVRVDDAQFRMRGQVLTARFEPGAAGTKSSQPALKTIEASGKVEAAFDKGSLRAEWVMVHATPDDKGRPAPSRLEARGDVVVEDPAQRLEAEELEATFARADPSKPSTGKAPDPAPAPEAGKAPAEPKKKTVNVELEHIRARGDIRLAVAGGTTVRGDHLTADAIKGTAEMTGTPVVVMHRGAKTKGQAPPLSELHVLNLKMQDRGRMASSSAAGRFIYTEVDGPEGKGRRINVTWTDHMRFDDHLNTLRVFGKVVAEAEDSPTELNRLSAGEMALHLVDPKVLARAKGEPKPTPAGGGDAKAPEGLDSALGTRRLREMTARGEVVLLGTRWKTPQKKVVLTRFRASGPLLRFRQIGRVANIVGPGNLLIEDYRPNDRQAVKKSLKASPVSGRGATLFSWHKQMTLDESAKDMVLEGQVRMRHQPLGSKDLVELQTDRLVADMRTTEGVGPVGMTKVQSLDIH
ncbi:MAG: hypothetical protein OER86_07570, partial [Phycisphaerae bacterium]|nr:hypothetical protein [Phycisphaerae bacterium]